METESDGPQTNAEQARRDLEWATVAKESAHRIPTPAWVIPYLAVVVGLWLAWQGLREDSQPSLATAFALAIVVPNVVLAFVLEKAGIRTSLTCAGDIKVWALAIMAVAPAVVAGLASNTIDERWPWLIAAPISAASLLGMGWIEHRARRRLEQRRTQLLEADQREGDQ